MVSVTQHPPRISLCMIVRNEEKFLAGCLDCVRQVVDEMIILDTGSDDRTASIALSYGASVVPYVWQRDFSAARNAALGQTSGDWVLYLDADERLASGQEEMIRGLVLNPSAGAYRARVVGSEHHQSGVQRMVNVYPRLFRNVPGVRFEGRIHEQISPSLERAGLPIVNSALVIHHLGYEQSPEILRDKANRNLLILEESVREHPEDWYLRFQLGSSLNNLGRYAEAESQLRCALDSQNIPAGVRASIFNLLAEVLLGQEDPGRAFESGRESLRLAPRQVAGYWLVATAQVLSRRFAQAIETLETLLKRLAENSGIGSEIVSDRMLTRGDVHCQIGLCCEQLGEGERALHEFCTALEHDRTLPDAWAGAARIHHGSGRRSEALKTVQEGLTVVPDDGRLYSHCVQWLLEEGDLAGASAHLRKAAGRNIISFELARFSFDIALRTRDGERAQASLGEMKRLVSPGNTALKIRLDVMAAKLCDFFS